jgi:hypothetical protein
LILVDGTRSEGAPKRAEACIQKLEKRLAQLPAQRAEVESIKAAFRGLNKDKCRPACVIVEASGRVVVAHTGKSRAAVAVDGSFTFVTPPREEGELSSGGSTKIEVDVLGGPMGERMRIALFSRVLAEHVPLMDVLPAETEEVASADVLEGRAHDCCRVCEHRSWENDREGCGMLDCMSLLLVDVRRRRTCDVPGPAESDSDAETTES